MPQLEVAIVGRLNNKAVVDENGALLVTGAGGGGGGITQAQAQAAFEAALDSRSITQGVARTPVMLRDATGTNITIDDNIYSLSVANVGSTTATVTITGSPDVPTDLEAGEVVNFEAGSANNYFLAGTFILNSGTSELLFTYIK